MMPSPDVNPSATCSRSRARVGRRSRGCISRRRSSRRNHRRAGAWTLSALAVEMEIGRIELSELGELRPVVDGDLRTAPGDQAGLAQLAHRAIDMHEGEAESVAKVGLGEGKIEARPVDLAQHFEAHIELADEMGE